MNGWIWESMNEWLDNNDKNGWMDCWMTMIKMDGQLTIDKNGRMDDYDKNGWMDCWMTMIRM